MKFQELEVLKNEIKTIFETIIALEGLYEKGQKRFSSKENRLLRKYLVELKKKVPSYRKELVKIEKEYKEHLKQK